MKNIRPISWIKSARKDFENFPLGAQSTLLDALTIAADGGFPDISKPFKGVGTCVFELALQYRSDAYRVIYAVRIGDDLWVIHAFQKKSKSGIKTPQTDIELIKQRLKRLKELLR